MATKNVGDENSVPDTSTTKTDSNKHTIWRYQIFGIVVVTIAIGILLLLLVFIDNPIAFYLGIGSLIFYFFFWFTGPGIWCGRTLKIRSTTMKEAEELFNDETKCRTIKSIDEIQGEYKGSILSYNFIASFGMNLFLLHGWYGKSFYKNTACPVILTRWVIIPTIFKTICMYKNCIQSFNL